MTASTPSLDSFGEAAFKVGEWWVHPQLNELGNEQTTVRIEARSLQVLICLARLAPQVVSRERIIQEVWGADAFVTDEALSHAVWELRRVFDDDARNPRYIQTISGKGYRLVVEVTRSSGEAEPRVGARVGHYRIEEEVGSGAMGVVYRATDCQLNRTVALKFLAPELTRDEIARRRFLREAKLAAALDHPNLATVYGFDETAKRRQYIVTAFYDGGSLKDRLELGPLDVPEAITIGRQLGDGLAEAHRHGIIHRDVKPANILLTRTGTAKIGDFGIAKLDGGTRLTQTGKSLGTPAYKSPEQSRGNPVDHRSDIWSLGVALYEMLGGNKPFRGDSEPAIVRSILDDEPATLRDADGKRLPEPIESIVLKALAKEPEDRYRTADELSFALSELGRKKGEPAPRVRTSNRVRWLVAAGIVLILGFAWTVSRLRPDSAQMADETTVAETTLSEVEKYLEGSRNYEIDGFLERAEAGYLQALEALPDHPRVLAQLALLQMRLPGALDNWEEIRTLVERALYADGELGQSWVAKAKLLLRERKLNEAEAAARKAIELTPDDDPDADRPQTALGEVLIALGRIEEGLAVIQEGESRQGGYIRARLVRGFYLWQHSQPDKAVTVYKEVLRYRPRHGPSLNNLGVFYLKWGRFADALPKLSLAFKLKPSPKRANNVGTAHFYLDGWVKALDWYQKAIKLDPEYGNGYGGAGDALDALERPDEAVTYWQLAVEKYERRLATDERQERRAQMAVYLAKLGRHQDALAEIKRALKHEPEHSEINFSASKVYALTGHKEEVYEAARRAARGMASLALFIKDPCFKDFQDDPRFRAILKGQDS